MLKSPEVIYLGAFSSCVKKVFLLSQSAEQLSVNAAEAAVAHHQ